MRRSSLRIVATTLAMLGSLSLSGCLASTESQMPPTLERERTAEDALPDGVEVSATGGAEPKADTSRFVGEFEGTLIYLTHSTIREYVCVIAVEPAVDSMAWGTSCGNPFGLQAGTGSVEVRLTVGGVIPQDDGQGTSDSEWTLLNDDVLARHL